MNLDNDYEDYVSPHVMVDPTAPFIESCRKAYESLLSILDKAYHQYLNEFLLYASKYEVLIYPEALIRNRKFMSHVLPITVHPTLDHLHHLVRVVPMVYCKLYRHVKIDRIDSCSYDISACNVLAYKSKPFADVVFYFKGNEFVSHMVLHIGARSIGLLFTEMWMKETKFGKAFFGAIHEDKIYLIGNYPYYGSIGSSPDFTLVKRSAGEEPDLKEAHILQGVIGVVAKKPVFVAQYNGSVCYIPAGGKAKKILFEYTKAPKVQNGNVIAEYDGTSAYILRNTWRDPQNAHTFNERVDDSNFVGYSHKQSLHYAAFRGPASFGILGKVLHQHVEAMGRPINAPGLRRHHRPYTFRELVDIVREMGILDFRKLTELVRVSGKILYQSSIACLVEWGILYLGPDRGIRVSKLNYELHDHLLSIPAEYYDIAWCTLFRMNSLTYDSGEIRFIDEDKGWLPIYAFRDPPNSFHNQRTMENYFNHGCVVDHEDCGSHWCSSEHYFENGERITVNEIKSCLGFEHGDDVIMTCPIDRHSIPDEVMVSDVYNDCDSDDFDVMSDAVECDDVPVLVSDVVNDEDKEVELEIPDDVNAK